MSAICVRLITFPWMWLFMKNPFEGAQCAIRLATDPQLKKVTGEYFKWVAIAGTGRGCRISGTLCVADTSLPPHHSFLLTYSLTYTHTQILGYLQRLRNCANFRGWAGQGIGQEVVHADHKNAPARYQTFGRQGGVHHGDTARPASAASRHGQLIYVKHAGPSCGQRQQPQQQRRDATVATATSICIWLNNCRIRNAFFPTAPTSQPLQTASVFYS